MALYQALAMENECSDETVNEGLEVDRSGHVVRLDEGGPWSSPVTHR